MAQIMTGNWSLALLDLGTEFVGDKYRDHPKLYPEMFTVEHTNDRYKIGAMTAGLSLASLKSEGAPGYFDSMVQTWNQKFEIVTYSTGFSITMEMLEDNQSETLDLTRRGSEETAKAHIYAQEVLGAGVYNGGFSANLSGDGVSIFNNAHPIAFPARGISTYSNRPAVDADVSEAAFEAMIIQGRLMVDERANAKMVEYDRIFIHPQQEPTVGRILRGALRYATADNDINWMKSKGYLQKDPLVNPYFTSTTAWFARAKDLDNGFMFYIKKDPDLTSDNEFSTRSARYLSVSRWVPGVIDPRDGYGSNGP